MSIIKPLFDKREFKSSKMENNIKYVLVSDKTLDRSYVYINVKCGSFNEPPEYGGLAHFLEHMLFMGSEKYKGENDFNNKLTEYGGMSNAYTTDYETAYYMILFTEGLHEMLDIFSRFFIDPLFLQDSVEREMNAVNNEHLKNINTDMWMLEHFCRSLSNKNLFTTGSLETLNKPDIRDKLIEFYKKYYVSNNISICIASKLSIDELEKMINTTFIDVKKHSNNHTNNGIEFKEKGCDYFLKSISELYELNYVWEIPEQYNTMQYRTLEFNILGTLLTDNNEKGMKFYLINNGLIDNMHYAVNNYGIFTICFSLTQNGMDNIDKIDSILYGYLETIYDGDIMNRCKFLNSIYQENFNNMNRMDNIDLCNMLSSNHHYYESNNIYIANTIIQNIKENSHYVDLYRKYINNSNQIRILQTKKYHDETNLIKLSHYNTSYCKITLPNQSMESITFHPNNDNINPYMNSQLKIVEDLDIYEKPYLLDDRYWYGGCSRFNEPTIHIHLQFANHKLFKTVELYILLHIFTNLINFIISIKFYKAMQLGYHVVFNINTTLSTFYFNINCPNDINKIKIFLKEIIDFICNIKHYIKIISDTYIESIITKFKKNIVNLFYLNAADYNKYILSLLLNTNEYSPDIILQIKTKVRDVKKFYKKLFENVMLTTLVYGNINSSDALFEDLVKFTKLFKYANQTTCISPMLSANPFWLCDDNICPINNKTIILNHPNKEQTTNSIMFYYNIGKFTPKLYILSSMMIDILHDSFFDELRTKQQLGYLVKMYKSSMLENYYMLQHIQSNIEINKVITAINIFNTSLLKFIDKNKFEDYKHRIREQINENETSLMECYQKYSYEILHKTYMFDRKKILDNNINKITFDELINTIKSIINPDNCIKIIIKGHVKK